MIPAVGLFPDKVLSFVRYFDSENHLTIKPSSIMSDLKPAHCTGIQANNDIMKAALEPGPLPDTNKNFPFNNFQSNPVERRVSFKGDSFILTQYDNSYSKVDLQGDTSRPPRLVVVWTK